MTSRGDAWSTASDVSKLLHRRLDAIRFKVKDMRHLAILTLLTLALTTPAALAAVVHIEVRDGKGKPASDAVVWAIPKDRPVRPARDAQAVMDQINRTFIPHVLPVQVGTSVSFPNRDNVRHQVYSFSPPKSFQLPLYIGTPANPVVFDKPGIVALGCNIHDQMSAFIVVVETPHFGRSENDGKITLERLPGGEYELHLWHPEMAHPFEPIGLILEEGQNQELIFRVRKK